MNKKTIRFCTQIGHEQIQVTHICIFQDCRQMDKQCCNLCMNEGIHNHGQHDNEHIRVDQEIQNIPKKTNDDQEDKNKIIKPIDFQNRKYNVKLIDNEVYYNIASISNNEKYFAYLGNSKMLKIYDISIDKIIKEIKCDYYIQTCQFTVDSSRLYVGFYDYERDFNLVYCYQVNKNFKIQFQLQIKEGKILFFSQIQNLSFIMTGYQNNIIRIDNRRKKLLFHQFYSGISGQFSDALDYNYSNDWMIIADSFNSIQIYNCGNRKSFLTKYKLIQMKLSKYNSQITYKMSQVQTVNTTYINGNQIQLRRILLNYKNNKIIILFLDFSKLIKTRICYQYVKIILKYLIIKEKLLIKQITSVIIYIIIGDPQISDNLIMEDILSYYQKTIKSCWLQLQIENSIKKNDFNILKYIILICRSQEL